MTAPTMGERTSRLEARLQGYHEQGLADVLELIDYLRDEGDTVIAGGSLSIDQGNKLSDLDMVIVGPTTNTSAVPLEHWVGSLRVDAWTRATAEIEALYAQAEAALASDGPMVGEFGTTAQEQQLKLLHRIAFGVVIEGEPVQPTTSGRSTQEVARDLLTREYAERARESLAMAALAHAAGSDLTAATVGRMGVEEAFHAVLHARGVPFSGDKWLAEQVQAFPDLSAQYDAIIQLPAKGEPLAPYTAHVLALGSELLGTDLSLAAVGPDLAWEHEELTLLPIGKRRLLTSELHGTGWELEPEEAELWKGFVDSKGEDETTFDHPTGDGAAEAFLLRMYEVGMVRAKWKRGLPLSALSIDLGGAR